MKTNLSCRYDKKKCRLTRRKEKLQRPGRNRVTEVVEHEKRKKRKQTNNMANLLDGVGGVKGV